MHYMSGQRDNETRELGKHGLKAQGVIYDACGKQWWEKHLLRLPSAHPYLQKHGIFYHPVCHGQHDIDSTYEQHISYNYINVLCTN
jgi:hypothetical protein